MSELINAIIEKRESDAMLLLETTNIKSLFDTHQHTVLMMACMNGLEILSLSILDKPVNDLNLDNKSDTQQTALMIACEYTLESVAIAIIHLLQQHHMENTISQIDKSGSTALLYACSSKLQNAALIIINTGHSNPGISNSSKTALLTACINEWDAIALAIINTGDANIMFISHLNGNTALLAACAFSLSLVATQIISILIKDLQSTQTTAAIKNDIKSYIAHKQTNNADALIYACAGNLDLIAIKLIKLGLCDPSLQTNNRKRTSLMTACINNLPTVAIALLKTGNCNPGAVSITNNTALMYACLYNLELVALAILHTGNANIQHVSDEHHNALYYAENALIPMRKVINAIKAINAPQQVNHNLSMPRADASNIKISLDINNLADIPPAIQAEQSIMGLIDPINKPEFLNVISKLGFCMTDKSGVSPQFVRGSLDRAHMIIVISTPYPDLNLIGFATIQFLVDHIYIDVICGDATYQKISNILIGIIEQFCIILNIYKIKLESVPNKVPLYKKFGFVINPGQPNGQYHMTNTNQFNDIFPLVNFSQHVGQITRRHSGFHTGRSPITPLSPLSPITPLSPLSPLSSQSAATATATATLDAATATATSDATLDATSDAVAVIEQTADKSIRKISDILIGFSLSSNKSGKGKSQKYRKLFRPAKPITFTSNTKKRMRKRKAR